MYLVMLKPNKQLIGSTIPLQHQNSRTWGSDVKDFQPLTNRESIGPLVSLWSLTCRSFGLSVNELLYNGISKGIIEVVVAVVRWRIQGKKGTKGCSRGQGAQAFRRNERFVYETKSPRAKRASVICRQVFNASFVAITRFIAHIIQ